MIKFQRATLMAALAVLLTTSGAQAVSFTGDSLHGASGELTIIHNGDNSIVTWALDTTGFHDASAVATDHRFLTDIAFKISGMTSVELLEPIKGLLHYSSNINQGANGCVTAGGPGSRAGFACLDLLAPILATDDQVISVSFLVGGDLDLEGEMSFRGKYGVGRGWIISESGRGQAAVPEPSAALVFGVGAVIFGRWSRRRR